MRAANHPKTHAGAPRSVGHTRATQNLRRLREDIHASQTTPGGQVLSDPAHGENQSAPRRGAPARAPACETGRGMSPPTAAAASLHFAAAVGQQSRPEHTRTQLEADSP